MTAHVHIGEWCDSCVGHGINLGIDAAPPAAPRSLSVELAAEVMARHHEYMGGCAACCQTEGPWPCDAYRLAVESEARGL